MEHLRLQAEVEYCRAQSAEASALAATETLPMLRDVLLTSAASWAYLAQKAEEALHGRRGYGLSATAH